MDLLVQTGLRQIEFSFLRLSFILGTHEEQIGYCFKIYDLNEDGFISKEEMLTMMGNCLFQNKNKEEEEGDEGVKVKLTIEVGRRAIFNEVIAFSAICLTPHLKQIPC